MKHRDIQRERERVKRQGTSFVSTLQRLAPKTLRAPTLNFATLHIQKTHMAYFSTEPYKGASYII